METIMFKSYAGIGSRKTPVDILAYFTLLAGLLERDNFVLNSGGANGADSAFEAGVKDPANKQIFLPWPNFNGNSSLLTAPSSEAYDMAERFHPAWNRCSVAARKFHARNCHQVLGPNLKTPVDFIVCWTPYGEVTGGTGQALRIAKANEIAIYNFGVGPNKHFIVEDELKQHVDELGIAEAQDEFDKTNGPSWV
jgi:hypothetical protein